MNHIWSEKTCNFSVSKKLQCITYYHLFKKDFILFLERGESRENERERKINVWLPLAYRLLGGTWPTTQAMCPDGNRTHYPVVGRPALNPLSHTSKVHITVFL